MHQVGYVRPGHVSRVGKAAAVPGDLLALLPRSDLRLSGNHPLTHHVSRLQRRLQQAQVDTIIALLASLEARDPYTHHHSINVAILADHFAQACGLSQADAHRVHVAALLHDMGKIGIPDSILMKPGRLTAEEFTAMKEHSAIGATMLQPVDGLVREALLVLHHHEWWDGTGYPCGLHGEEIPLGARIIQVADSIDAMMSPRSYRPSCGIEHTLSELQKGRGHQFDPQVADVAARRLERLPGPAVV